jgi:hypothetical protein
MPIRQPVDDARILDLPTIARRLDPPLYSEIPGSISAR